MIGFSTKPLGSIVTRKEGRRLTFIRGSGNIYSSLLKVVQGELPCHVNEKNIEKVGSKLRI